MNRVKIEEKRRRKTELSSSESKSDGREFREELELIAKLDDYMTIIFTSCFHLCGSQSSKSKTCANSTTSQSKEYA